MSLVVCFQNESVTALKKARQQYYQRCDELEKAKAVTAKTVEDTAGIKTLDKRRKSKDEAKTKVHLMDHITSLFFTPPFYGREAVNLLSSR